MILGKTSTTQQFKFELPLNRYDFPDHQNPTTSGMLAKALEHSSFPLQQVGEQMISDFKLMDEFINELAYEWV